MTNSKPEQDHTDLIDEKIDPIKAIEEKMRRGRVKYGPEWVGHRPIVEAHEEALDLGAYLLEEWRLEGDGPRTMLLDELIRSAINIVYGIRNAILMSQERR